MHRRHTLSIDNRSKWYFLLVAAALAAVLLVATTAATSLIPGRLGDLLFLATALLVLGVPAYSAGRKLDHLRGQSRTDTLTGVGNRRFLRDRLSQEVARYRRSQSPLSVLMLDVDELKKLNDQLGHQIGDLALRSVASSIVECVRESDTVGRVGGDEFVVVAPETDGVAANALASRISSHVRKCAPPGLSSRTIHVSIGVATASPRASSANDLLEAADRAMYLVKVFGDASSYEYSARANGVPLAPQVRH